MVMLSRKAMMVASGATETEATTFEDFTQSFGANTVLNGDMELDDANWPNLSTPTTNARSDEQAHGGIYSRKIVGNNNTGARQGGVSVLAYRWFEVEAWQKVIAGQGRVETGSPTVILPTILPGAEWVHTSALYHDTAPDVAVDLRSRATGSTVYFDDVSVRQINAMPMLAMPSGDGTYQLDITLPVTPAAGKAIKWFYRAADEVQYEDDYWCLTLVRNSTNTAWSLLVDSVAADVPTNHLTVADVGDPDALVIELSGTLQTISTAEGETVTERGTVDVDYLTDHYGMTVIHSDGFTIDKLTGTGGVEVGSSKTLLSGEGATDWLGRPRLLEVGGVWLLLYRQGGHHGSDANAVLHLRFSNNKGVSWTEADTDLSGQPVAGFPLGSHDGNTLADFEMHQAPNGDLLIAASEWDGDGTQGIYLYRGSANGTAWTEDGLMMADTNLQANGQMINIGDDIYYATWYDPNGDKIPPFTVGLYKSTDNGVAANWTKVADIATGVNECALVHQGGNNLLAILRDDSQDDTYVTTTSNLGANWTAKAVAPRFGVIQRPRLLRFPGTTRLYLIGRDFTSAGQKTVIWYTDNGAWAGPFTLEDTWEEDAGYCDMLPRNNTELYVVSYAGNNAMAALTEHVLAVPG